MKLKNIDECWDSGPYLPLQNPVVLPAVPWQQVEFLMKSHQIHENV